MKAARTDTPLAELQETRAILCRLTRDRALETLEDAEAFLGERGMLTRTTDCSLPSLFEACHEEPYAPDKPGFGQWPRTKWGWSFALARRPGVYALKIHRGKTLYVDDEVARLIDPICRSEIERMHEEREWARILDHLAEAGPATREDLRDELDLGPKELRKILSPLERCGAVVARASRPHEDGEVDAFEYLRWDQLFAEPVKREATLDELVVRAIRAAVVATEREVPRWFSWTWRWDKDLVGRLVSAGRLVRPATGWIAAPPSA